MPECGRDPPNGCQLTGMCSWSGHGIVHEICRLCMLYINVKR